MRKVVVSDTGNGLKHQIKAGEHTLTSDAPKEVGGQELGPDPHEYLLAALGACTSMTMKLFAGKRGWDLQSVEVLLEEDQVDDGEGKKKTVISREIKVKGELNQEQIDTLKNIADKCPVHKLLMGEKSIVTNLKSAAGAVAK
jgi:putative redox protein